MQRPNICAHAYHPQNTDKRLKSVQKFFEKGIILNIFKIYEKYCLIRENIVFDMHIFISITVGLR